MKLRGDRQSLGVDGTVTQALPLERFLVIRSNQEPL